MRLDIKELWTAALRSGKYKQGHGVLTRRLINGKEEDCCLGVLCKVLMENGLIQLRIEVDGDGRVHYDDALHYLPSAVVTLAELQSINPEVHSNEVNNADEDEDEGITTLAAMNDRLCSFEKIADAIERDL